MTLWGLFVLILQIKETRGILAVLTALNYLFKAAAITLNTKIKAAREVAKQFVSLLLCFLRSIP